MTNQLHLLLKSLCLNTEWNYALFWKLQHGPRMLLTCEDAYCADLERYHHPDNMCLDYNRSNLLDSRSCSPLELAVEMMSYHAHPLGQGVIGAVALTGNHIWAFADKHLTDYCSPFEHCGGWQSQFSAGIRTLVAVAVVPYGVVQLGSLSKVPEDLCMVYWIRDAFAAVPDSSMGFNPRKSHSGDESSSCLSEISARISGAGVFGDSISSLVGAVTKETGVTQAPRLAEPMNMDERLGGSIFVAGTVDHDFESSNVCLDQISSYNATLPTLGSGTDMTYLQADAIDSAACTDQTEFCETEPFCMQIQGDSGKSMDLQMGTNKIGALHIPFKFSAGCELYDVLGSPFGEANNTETSVQMAEVMDNSCLSVVDSGSDNLLEAVVAKVLHGRTDVKSKESFNGSHDSVITTTENVSQPSCRNLDVGSVSYSFDQSVVQKERWHCFSPEAWFSSGSQNVLEPVMVGKKRARTGENRKPRPRDRQLIQDRIKELRQIVPSGSKCSIDSLLERTIKHMLYMQSLTKIAEKVGNLTESKIPKSHDKVTLKGGSISHDQGSTWAVEVGTDLKVCPIIIEDINMNGQMRIQVTCDDYSNFLEIAEIIRSLGLTILKSVTHTETHGKKTSMQFVVEGQNNRNVHRMDIFWPLMQILQSKSII